MNKKKIVEKTINLYSNTGWKSLFAKIRFWDAPYLEVEKIIPNKGKIIDLGCGEGIFANFMALASSKRNVLGIEFDKKRVKDANRGVSNANFKQGDVLKVKIPQADCIVMFHLLHHLSSFEDQEKLIKKSVKVLSSNGRLVIVEIDKKPSFKYLITWITDYFLVPWIFERRFFAKKIFFRKRSKWVELLKKEGFKVRSFGIEKGKPFTHVVIIGNKK